MPLPPNLADYLKERPYLFWYVRDTEYLSQEALVEQVLNYGTWRDVQVLISLLGINTMQCIFSDQQEKRRNNYRPAVAHYFKLYFAANASH